jgi:hypothetical protein
VTYVTEGRDYCPRCLEIASGSKRVSELSVGLCVVPFSSALPTCVCSTAGKDSLVGHIARYQLRFSATQFNRLVHNQIIANTQLVQQRPKMIDYLA